MRTGFRKIIVLVEAAFLIWSGMGCSDRPFGYIRSPLETLQAPPATSTKLLPPTRTPRPQATSTKVPTQRANSASKQNIGEPYLIESASPIITGDERFVFFLDGKIFVIKETGEVVSYKVSETSIATPVQYSGALVAANEWDRYVVGLGNRILVINETGDVWAHEISGTTIQEAYYLPGALVAVNSSDVLVIGQGRRLLVINSSGEVWAHDLTNDSVGEAYYLENSFINVNSLKAVTVMDDRLLVITQAYKVLEYVISSDRLSEKKVIPGALVASDPADLYVLGEDSRLLVVNSLGEVWVHDYSDTPTSAPRPTNTPLPAHATATEVLPFDVTVDVINQLAVTLHFRCEGPNSLDFSVSGFQTKKISMPSGTYSCTITALGYDPLYKLEHWDPGEWEWTFSNQ